MARISFEGGEFSFPTPAPNLQPIIIVGGVNQAMASLTIQVNQLEIRGIAGLYAAGEIVKRRAQQNLRQHRWHGRTAAAVTVQGPPRKGFAASIQQAYDDGRYAEGQAINIAQGMARGGSLESGGAVLKIPAGRHMSVVVGIPHNKWPMFAVGATFEHGWKSKNDKQPPAAPIAKWVMSKGIEKDPDEAKRVAFVIARTIALRGYVFGEFHWLGDAWRQEGAAAQATLDRYLSSAFADQPRTAGGLFDFRR